MLNSNIRTMNLKLKGRQAWFFFRKRRLLLCMVIVSFIVCEFNVYGEESDGISDLGTGKDIFSDANFSVIEPMSNQQSQKISVNGRVVDKGGMGIPSVTVLVKGTTKGTITDYDGNYSLVLDGQNVVLVFSSIGFKSQEMPVRNQTAINVTLLEDYVGLEEVVAVGYGTQKKETMTGAVSSVGNQELLRSPNASVANTLSGQIAGLTTVQRSGQPGLEDPKIFIRGLGSLTEAASTPLILVDGVERSFFQMDPNEIESVTVLKDASATAVFGVQGANGVIIVTTRRGKEGTAKISVNSSVGVQSPTSWLDGAGSYTYATVMNERDRNDGASLMTFSDYALERFQMKDEPIMYPDVDWRRYLMNNTAVQTQHNINVSGGTENVRYFMSAGFLYQDGFMKKFDELDYNNNFNYNRYNYRANLDIDVTKSTLMQIGIGGIVGQRHEPAISGEYSIWYTTNWSPPMSSPGVVGGKVINTDNTYFPKVLLTTPLTSYYGTGFNTNVNNTMNMDLALKQNLDAIIKGLSLEVKGAYNTTYGFEKSRTKSVETYTPFYHSTIYNPGLPINDPSFDKTIIYRVAGKDSDFNYKEANSKRKDWYFETSLRFNRKYGKHNIGTLLLYNQKKRYYPSQFPELPTAYVGLVGRQTYDYASKYLLEFNVGYNGSENFAPGRRYGFFPAGSIGYVVSEEPFMKNQNIINYLKLRASVGLVGNDNMNGNRYLYLPDTYKVDLQDAYKSSDRNGYLFGYNFGVDSPNRFMGAEEQRLGNSFVTWETSLKKNLGIDINFFDSKLKITADYFTENRKDILISRSTIPVLTGLGNNILPVVNMGKVDNQGFEVDINWNQKIGLVRYWINPNVSYARNEIVFMDEVEPNEAYMRRTGRPVGEQFGYVSLGMYGVDDFEVNGDLKEGFPTPTFKVYPGDVSFKDLNGDGVINADDQTYIGNPNRPAYVFGLNYGVEVKGFTFTMNWLGAAERDLMLVGRFREPFNGESRGLFQYFADERWTPETASTATMPRISTISRSNNYRESSMFVRDASYIRLKNISLGYKFEGHLLKQIGISALGVQLTGYNVLTFSKFKYMDPESQPNNDDTYPVSRIYNLGVNVTF